MTRCGYCLGWGGWCACPQDCGARQVLGFRDCRPGELQAQISAQARKDGGK